jgi:DNA-binding response OmpR family regulator
MPLKILVAEDEKMIQKIYQASLPESLFLLKIVGDGEEAIRLYDEWQPDIIVLDCIMPLLNGFQVLKLIREERQDKSTVIVVTGESDKDTIIACAKLGVNGYMVKPFVEEELAPKIFKIYKMSHSGKT